MKKQMKLLVTSIAALALSAASLSAGAALKPTDLFGEPARAPSAERAIITAVVDRTITITDETKWVNVTRYEVIRFVSNARELAWYFDGVAQPLPFDLAQIAPAGVVRHSVTGSVLPKDRDLPRRCA